jgi:hypothetical protein
VEATVKNGSAVKEFSFKHICGCIVETHCLELKLKLINKNVKRGKVKMKVLYRTLSQEETRRLSLWLENRMLEIPSDGGFDNSRPDTIGVVAMFLLLLMLLLARVSNGGVR